MKKPKHALNMIVLVIATALFCMAQWQHELLLIDYFWCAPDVYNIPFLTWGTPRITITIGQVSDLTLFLVFVALVLSDLALWFWND